jgi:hypothetical protein
LHAKHAPHVEAAALPRPPGSISGVCVPPLVEPPYRLPVLGLSSASTVPLTCLATSGMLEKVVKISAPAKSGGTCGQQQTRCHACTGWIGAGAPMSPLSWKHVASTAKQASGW